MALRIEDYALIGDTTTAALVGTNGSIDWLCAPRFDSPAFFAALLGSDANGHWQIAPAAEARRVERRYRPGTLVLETDFETSDGLVRVIDSMPLGDESVDVIRMVEGLRGRVAMQMRLNPRFDYGRLVPATGRIDQGMFAVAGPDAVCLRTPVEIGAEGGATASAAFTVSEGERVPFHLAWYPSHAPRPEPIDPFNTLARTESWWREWSGRCTYEGPHRRGRPEIADHAEGAHVRADGRDRCRADDVAAGGDRGRAKLGLPLLLAARRLVHAGAAGAGRLHGGGCCLARLAVPGDRRRPEPAADHVRHRRRAPADGARAALVVRLRRLEAGAHRQRRQRAVPARHLRRSDGGLLRGVGGRAARAR